jgi:hypothetical protein
MPPLANTALAASIALSALGAVIVCLLTIFFGFTPEGEEPPGTATRRRLLTRVGHAVAAACFAGTAIMLAVVLAQAARAVSPATGDARVPALDAKLDAHVQRLHGVEERMKDSEQTLERLEMEVSEVAARRMATDAAPAMSQAPKPDEPPRVVPAGKPAARPRAALAPAKPMAKATPPAPRPVERGAAAVAPPPAPPTERLATPAPIEAPAASPATAPIASAPPVATAPAVTPPVAAAPPAKPSSAPGSSPPAATTSTREAEVRTKFMNDWRAIQRGWDSAGDDFRRAIGPLRGDN